MVPLFRLRPVLAVLAAVVLTAPAVWVLATPAPAQAEGPETVVGELVQAWPEYLDADAAGHREAEGPLTWIESSDGDSVRVPTEELPDAAGLAAGAVVEVVVGGEVRDEAVDAGLEPARAVVDVDVLEAAPAAPVLSPAGGINEVTVVMARPGGVPTDGRQLSDVVAAVDGPVRSFWAEQTGGQVQLQVTGQHDWIATTATCAAPHSLWNEVAATVGWTSGPGKHLLVYVSRAATGCAAGLAQVGTGLGGGGRLYVTEVLTSLIGHEFGHNFSLGHASARQCDGAVDAGTCRLVAYDDGYDVMGYSWSEVGTLGAPHADRLGVLPAERVVALTPADVTRTVVLSPVAGPSGVRALRLTGDAGTQYWVELRSPTGRDDWLGTTRDVYGLGSGVLVRRSASGNDTSLLLDTTPSPAASWDGDTQVALRTAGQRVALAESRFQLELVRITASEAEIRVTISDQPPHPVDELHRLLGGDTGVFGAALGGLSCGLPGEGCTREFAGGLIAWSPGTGARAVERAEAVAWLARGGAGGSLGYPVGWLSCTTAGSCQQTFQGGQLARGPGGTPVLVASAYSARWQGVGGVYGALGRPLAEEVCGRRGGGCFQAFQGGAIYWSPATGMHVVAGDMARRWGREGWEVGPLGYPVGAEVCGRRGGGCFQAFQGGAIYWSPAAGMHVVFGGMLARWGQEGWEAGALGYPVGAEVCGLRDGGCFQPFQGGAIYWSRGSGAHVVLGAIGLRWAQQGWETGWLGYPVGSEVCGLRGGGCFQPFQGGAVYWSPASGAHPVGGSAGAIHHAWAAQGWEGGRLGYPVEAPQFFPRRGVLFQQRFQGGVLVLDGRGRVTTRR